MTNRSRKRLRQIVGRDSRVIRGFLGIIQQHEKEIIFGKKRKRIDQTKLDALTVSTSWGKNGNPPRLIVPHNMKKRFPRISANEIADCRKTAAAIYDSYLSLKKKRGKHSRPCAANLSRRIPRWTFPQCFKLINKPTMQVKWWINLRDSLDSVPENRRTHDRLLIPLKTSPYHINQLSRGEIKALQIFTDRQKKWWVTIAVQIQISKNMDDKQTLPNAVLGIDLGITKAACTTLLTETKVSETKYFAQKDKLQAMIKYDNQVSQLQRERDIRINNGQRHDGVTRKLMTIRSKRENVAKEYDRVMVRQLLNYIEELSQKFSLYVALGRVKGVRSRARKGNYQGNRFRALVHSWSFSRISQSLKHGLAQMGWKVDGSNSRFQAIPEQWTSIKCWKCGRKGHRPKQSLFVCSCGFRTNADRNGSLNIARRLIKLIPSLKNETKGLGRWVTPERAPAPKTGRRTSKRKSLLPRKDNVSHPRESAAVHFVQMDLSGFGDKTSRSDYDPAVAKTAEALSVASNDTPGIQQKQEAETVRRYSQ